MNIIERYYVYEVTVMNQSLSRDYYCKNKGYDTYEEAYEAMVNSFERFHGKEGNILPKFIIKGFLTE
jgi:hypothetical protein